MIFKVTTYNPITNRNLKPQFYIQSKGLNAGRPLREPKANCWIVETDIALAYEICTVLWISKIYEPHIIGSVIPFFRIHDYLKVTIPFLVTCKEYESVINESLETINSYDKLIDNSLSKLKLIRTMKIVTAHELLKVINP